MIDKRLLGTWQSDTRKTMRDIRNRRDIPEETQKRFKRLFGKLRLRYTRKRLYTEFHGDKSFQPYRVVAKNHYSVAIVTPGSCESDDQIYHIHFEGKYYSIWLGKYREFFKKIE